MLRVRLSQTPLWPFPAAVIAGAAPRRPVGRRRRVRGQRVLAQGGREELLVRRSHSRQLHMGSICCAIMSSGGLEGWGEAGEVQHVCSTHFGIVEARVACVSKLELLT